MGRRGQMNIEEEKQLFSKWPVNSVLQRRAEDMLRRIDRLPNNVLLGSDLETLAAEQVEEERIVVPILRDRDKTAEYGEAEVKIPTGDSYASVPGLRITFFVPFEGDPFVFNVRPTYSPSAFPIVKDITVDRELLIEYEARHVQGHDYDTSAAHDYLNRTLDEIRRHLEQVERHIDTYNTDLQKMARTRIDSRREKLLRDQRLMEGLGVPLRRRNNPPETHEVPLVRKKSPVTQSAASASSKPKIADEHYQHILSVITSMVKVMEYSPKAFVMMGEEDLRWHFLVQLNGQYQGLATGETFNFSGKTDILVRWADENVFVAECKIWRGEKSLMNALDQLLGYASWADTRTALLLFNRGGTFSSVLGKIPAVVRGHPNFDKQLPTSRSENTFRFRMRRADDPERQLMLTVLAFDVPTSG